MKQDIFIQQLRNELSSLPKQAVEEIVADYREYIGDGLAAGRSEEEVISALGDPVKLARELKAQASYRQWEHRRSFGNLMRVVVSIAGLGLLHLVLLVPFLIYLLILTAGYAVSSALTVAGLVAAVVIGSHALFGKPSLNAVPFTIVADHPASGHDSHASAGTAGSGDKDDEAKGAMSDFKDLKVVGDRYVLHLEDNAKLSLVTRAGPLEMRKRDDKLEIEAPDAGARQLLKPGDDGTYSIARSDVKALDMTDGDDSHLSIAQSGTDGRSTVWSLSDGGDRVSFEEDANGDTSHLSVRDGSDSVVIDNNRVSVTDGPHHVQVIGAGSTLGGVATGYALAMLPVGVIGLLLCIWLTRITWRALVRYVMRQIDVVSARLDREPAA